MKMRFYESTIMSHKDEIFHPLILIPIINKLRKAELDEANATDLPLLSGKGTVARLKSCLLSVTVWLSCPGRQMAMAKSGELSNCISFGSMV